MSDDDGSPSVRLASVLVLSSVLAGCVTEVLDPKPVRVAGDPDATMPTNVYLKTDVAGAAGTTIVAFDRKDWYVAGLERELPRIDWLVVEGTPKIDREVVVADVEAPADLAERFRYDEMMASEEQQASMDSEWDVRLDELTAERSDLGWLSRVRAQMIP